MKNQIKFDHNFIKLYDQKSAELLKVKIVSGVELDEEAIKIDTQYYVSHPIPNQPGDHLSGIEFCKLPKGSLLLLCFLGNKNMPFITYRKFNDASWRRFRRLLNQEFEIVLNES